MLPVSFLKTVIRHHECVQIGQLSQVLQLLQTVPTDVESGELGEAGQVLNPVNLVVLQEETFEILKVPKLENYALSNNFPIISFN